MDSRIKNAEIIVIALIFLFGLYLWTIPITTNPFPYGETDSSAHFSLGDYMGQNNVAATKLPYYLDFRYGAENTLNPGGLWYPPQYHTNLAIAEILGGDRVGSIFIFNAMLCLLIPVALFFVIRKLFSFIAATIVSIIYLFSVRDIMTFLWGQWPTLVSYSFIPVVLYLYYRYQLSREEQKPNIVYFYLMPILLAFQFLIHPLGAVIAVIVLSLFSVYLIIKERKLPFSIKNIAAIIGIFLVMIIGLAPTQTLTVFMFMSGQSQNYYGGSDASKSSITDLFSWYHFATHDAGYPPDYYSFSFNHNSWLIPFIILGILFCFYRRNLKDVLFLSLAAALYLLMHLHVLGINTAYEFRVFSLETFILYSFVGIAVYGLQKIEQFSKLKLHYIAVILLVIIGFSSFSTANKLLAESYQGPARLTAPQYDAAEWMYKNLESDAVVYDIGTLSLAKSMWIRSIAQRPVSTTPTLAHSRGLNRTSTHVLFDYSDPLAIGQQNIVTGMQEMEKEYAAVSKKVYDKNNIKVYAIENKLE